MKVRVGTAAAILVLTVFVVGAAGVSSCGAPVSNVPEQESAAAIGGNDAAELLLSTEISLEKLEPYQASSAQSIEITQNDIESIITQQAFNDAAVFFYRAQNGDICGGYQTADNRVFHLLTAYDALDNSGYQDGFSIAAYENVLGHDGFIMGYPIGAAYQAFEYYYLGDNGVPDVLAQTYNTHTVYDLDEDGNNERLSFYGIGSNPYIFYLKDSTVYRVDVVEAIQNEFTDWDQIYADEELDYGGEAGKPYISVFYCQKDSDEARNIAVCFTPEALHLQSAPFL